MKAAYYEKQGPAEDVLKIGEMADPQPGNGEVRIRIAASGINPGDVKKREDTFGVGMTYERVIPHSDGAGVIDRVGKGVPESRIGERCWCFGAQSYRPFGTAAEYTVVNADQAIPLPSDVAFEQGACLGIPGITAHRALHVAGPIHGKTVLVQGGGGAVGSCAVALAKFGRARVIATVRSDKDHAVATAAGADDVLNTKGLPPEDVIKQLQALVPEGFHHVVEVAFHANIGIDEQVLAIDGSVAAYATENPEPAIPFWPLVFKNIRLFFIGSDDFPPAAKMAAAADLNAALAAGWQGFEVARTFTLDEIADAHEFVETQSKRGRAVIVVS